MSPVLALVLMLGAAPVAPLEAAKRHLAAGQLDEVLFDLDGKTFAAGERQGAADVLAEAARLGLEKNDEVLALQFAQMALRLDQKQALALETGARASLRQKQFDPAESYADRLVAQSAGAPLPRLLRAEIALEEGEWTKVIALTRDVNAGALSSADRARLLAVVQAASRELGEREASSAQAKTLEQQLAAQMAKAQREASAQSLKAEARPVVVYGTAWCGYCRMAKQWLTARNVPFVAKDVEEDPAALEELNAKKRARGLQRQGGVPWIDVGGEGGQLLAGFDVPALERLFPAR
jgi:glutaredoxin